MTYSTLMRVIGLCVVALDFLLVLLTTVLAQHLRSQLSFIADGYVLEQTLDLLRVPLVIGWVIIIALLGGYSTHDFEAGTSIYRRVLNASVATTCLMSMSLFFGQVPMSRAYVLILLVVGSAFLLLDRLLVRKVLHLIYRRGIGTRKVIVVGHGPVLAVLIKRIREGKWLGLTPVAVAHASPREAEDLALPLAHVSEGLLPLAKEYAADLILFADGSAPSTTDFRRYLWQFERGHTELAVVSSIIDVASDRVHTRPIAGTQIVYVEAPRSASALSWGKRVFDVIAATLMLVAALPVMLVTALLVRHDGGPVLFRQTRVGRDGKPFQMLKFRSMVVNAEQLLQSVKDSEQTNKVMFKRADDPRITKVGAVIRRYSIDELPQLVNVIRGEMSLIGPRPPLPREVALYTDDEWRRLRVRPGLTGLWQISGRSDLSWEETVRLDLYYIDNWSLVQDLSILLRTVKAVLASRGAY
ncbi:MAG: sugar transferase [Actinomyces urogenitalis]|uniref:sugar transferase n=1 Tax=Actinomyces urogenitalis TaxID=103621 RepID=UPI002A834BA2|nr:sugar transferase [Actinomyces urogenitalis]MDY3677864.1 sugar transferase [Actinomyces urogenitalis]